jgi:PAS domain S-box-containing protein
MDFKPFGVARAGDAARKRAEITRAHLASIIESSDDAIISKDLEGIVTSWNAGAERIFGYSATEMIGRPVTLLIPPENPDEESLCIARIKGGERIEHYETCCVRKDGRRIDVSLTVLPIKDATGNIIGASKIARDITERKRAEAALRESEERFQAFMDNSPVIAWAKDEQGRHVYLNRTYESRFGVRLDDLRGKTDFDLWPPETATEFRKNDQAVLTAGRLLEVMEETRNPDGSRSTWWSFKFPFLDVGGQKYVGGMAVDITERKRAEALLAGEKSLLESIASGTPLAAVLEAVTRTVETLSSGMLCSILLLDADGVHVRHGAAPSLPDDYNRAIDGMAIGPNVGSCGTAAYRNQQVIVSDIATDPLWTDYRALALQHGLRACWSTPIRSDDGRVLGTFALYYREPRTPNVADFELIERMIHLTSIAIERKVAEQALQESEQQLREALEEREQLSRDLHDGIVQEIYAIGLGLEEAQRLVAEHANWAETKISDAIAGLNEVIREVREHIIGSAPQFLTGPQFRAELTALAKTMRNAHSLRFRFEIDAMAVSRLSDDAAPHVLNITREAISNSLRHSEGRSGLVSLQPYHDGVRLVVEDDGAGFDLQEARVRGQGLQNIEARAGQLAAKLHIRSGTGDGTRIVLDIPAEHTDATL